MLNLTGRLGGQAILLESKQVSLRLMSALVEFLAEVLTYIAP